MSNEKFGVNQICKLLGISKNTYYNGRNPQETFLQKYEKYKIAVEEVIEEHGSYGIRRIKAALLQEHSVVIGRDVLAKLLTLWELGLKRKTRKAKPSMIHKILKALGNRVNLLARVTVLAPFEAITSDITRISYGGGIAYLCVHKDLVGQMVYGYALDLNMKKELILKSLSKAKKQICRMIGKIPKNLICHQDQGSQYTSYDYVERVKKVGMVISYSEKGTPTDNAGQESFFGRFKDENRDEMMEIQTFEELEKFIDRKIIYYNERRLHTSIGYKSPKHFTNFYLKNLKNRFTDFRT